MKVDFPKRIQIFGTVGSCSDFSVLERSRVFVHFSLYFRKKKMERIVLSLLGNALLCGDPGCLKDKPSIFLRLYHKATNRRSSEFRQNLVEVLE